MALASRENRLARDEAITPQRSEETVLDMTLNCPSQNGAYMEDPMSILTSQWVTGLGPPTTIRITDTDRLRYRSHATHSDAGIIEGLLRGP